MQPVGEPMIAALLTSLHFITTWFGEIEIPVASYFAPLSQLSLEAFV